MKLLMQPNSWSCMPTSLAMLLDEDTNDIIKEIGHDGSEIIYEFLDEPQNRKGFHIQQLLKICLVRNMALIQFDKEVNTYNLEGSINFGDDTEYINKLMKDYDGILLGETAPNKSHAVAWNHVEHCIYDPNGTKYAKGWFKIESFLMLRDLNL